MNAKSAYQEYYEQVTKEAEKVPNALEISQTALWFKSVAIRALESKNLNLILFVHLKTNVFLLRLCLIK